MILESQIENEIVAYVRSIGGQARKLIDNDRRGWPDRTILLPNGRTIFIEVKRPGGKLRADQIKQIAELKALNIPVTVVDTLEGAIDFIDRYAKRRRLKP